MKDLLLYLMMLFPLAASADAVEIDGIRYNLVYRTKTAEVRRGSYSGGIVIPSKVTHENVDYDVTAIGECAFENCPYLSSVIIPNSVTSIGDEAFKYCFGLSSITIGSSVNKIGGGAFNTCGNLNAVHISDIEAWCKIDFTNAGSNPLSYSPHLYINDEEIINLIIPNGVTSIKKNAFYGFSCLNTITIPNSVTSIGKSAFNGCSGLTSITIPNSVTSIENGAFNGCTGLASAIIGNGVKTIGDSSFAYCNNLTTITMGNNVTSIDYHAFEGCTALTAVHITDIEAWCKIRFNNSNPLSYAHHLYLNGEEIRDLVIPNSVTSIENGAFRGCDSFITVSIPNSVREMGGHTFEDCSYLQSVFIGNSVKEIGSYAFSGCTSLMTINIPGNVTKLGKYGFWNCVNLSSVTLNNGLTTIEEGAFDDCLSLESIVFPSSVTSIDKYAISCPYLKKIVVDSENTIYDSRDNCNCLITTSTNTIMRGCAGSFIPSTATSIGKYAFEGVRGLTSITIPSSVNNIGYGAFHGCSDLNNIVIQNGVKTIGYGAFEATSIESVIIPASVTTIESNFYGNVFSNCPNLNSIVVEDGNVVYDSRNNCNAIIKKSSNTLISGCKKTIIPNSVTTIGPSAFLHCKTLYAINIPNSVSTIEENAFYGAGLASVIIGNGVKKIEDYAFWGCENLRNVVSLIEDPFNINHSCFACSSDYYDENLQDLVHNSEHEKLIYNNAKLIVPDGTIEKYKSTGAWKNFTNIIEQGQCSGVAPIGIVHLNGSDKVYTLDGIRLENIQKGLNIIRMKDGTTKKVVVK